MITLSLISVRELGADDGYVLDTVFAGLSLHSRHMRFHAPISQMTPGLRSRLADVDGRDHVALAAFAGQRREPVGLVRIIAIEPGRAELAVEVVDAWQGRGVGTRLLRAMKQRAGELGYHELVAEVLAENGAVLSLLRSAFPGSVSRRCGIEITLALPVVDTAFDMSDLLTDLVV
jgi:GNAT superfamily N-acetyltransferase